MKRFKKFFYESLNLSSGRYKIISPDAIGDGKYEYKGHRVIDTIHAIERYQQRSHIPDNRLAWYYRNALDWLDENGGLIYYLIFSRKLNQGMIVVWEPDIYDRSSFKKHMIVNTVLPVGAKDPNVGAKPGKPTMLVIIEHDEQKNYISSEFARYMSGLIGVPENEVNESKNYSSGVYTYQKRFGIKKNIELTIFVIEGKVWDIAARMCDPDKNTKTSMGIVEVD